MRDVPGVHGAVGGGHGGLVSLRSRTPKPAANAKPIQPAAISLPAFNRFCVFVLRSEKLPVRLQLRRPGGAVQWHRHTQRM